MSAGRSLHGAARGRATRAHGGGAPGRPVSLARLRSIAAFGLIALALVLAQRAAALHWLSHAVAATQAADPSSAKTRGDTPGHAGIVADHCDDCALFAALGAGAAVSTLVVATVDSAERRPLPFGTTAEARAPPLAFRSRAPPIPG